MEVAGSIPSWLCGSAVSAGPWYSVLWAPALPHFNGVSSPSCGCGKTECTTQWSTSHGLAHRWESGMTALWQPHWPGFGGWAGEGDERFVTDTAASGVTLPVTQSHLQGFLSLFTTFVQEKR